MQKALTLFVFCILIAVVTNLISCSQKPMSSNSAEASSQTSTQKLELTKTLGEQVIYQIKNKLVDSGLSQEQATAITNPALNCLALASHQPSSDNSLTLSEEKIDPNDIASFMPVFSKEILQALSSSNANISQITMKTKIVSVVIDALMTALANKLDHLEDAPRKNIPATIARAGISSLKDGFSSDNLTEAIGAVVASTTSNLELAGYTKDDYELMIPIITYQAIQGLRDATIDDRYIPKLIGQITYSNLRSLINLNPNKEQIDKVIAIIFLKTIESSFDIGIDTTSKLQNTVANMMQGAVKTLDQIDLIDINDLNTTLANFVTATLDALKTKIKASDLTYLIDDMMYGSISALENLRLEKIGLKTTTSDLLLLVNQINITAISHLIKIGINDVILLKSNLSSLTMGAMAAYSSLPSKIISQDSLKIAANDVAKNSITALFTSDLKILEHSFSELISAVSIGILAGLSQSGATISQLLAFSDNIKTGVTQALNSENITAHTINTYAVDAESAKSKFIAAMPIYCQNQGGDWNSSKESCNYLSQDPTVSTTKIGNKPTSQDYFVCNDVSGAILFRRDGTWFCDSLVTSSSSKVQCEQKKFKWVTTSSGGYCQIITPLIQCRTKTNQKTCQSANECLWDGINCLDTDSVSCASLWQERDCLEAAGCSFASKTSICINTSTIDCSDARTSTDCSTRANCHWNGSTCINATLLNCAAKITETSCTESLGCIWNGQYCQNMTNLSCSLASSSTACQANVGCIWSTQQNLCLKLTAVDCNATQESTCRDKLACSWSGSTCMLSANVSCESANTSSLCAATSGCQWSNDRCTNATQVACSNKDVTNCNATNGCFLNGNICQNAATFSCSGLDANVCEKTSACVWGDSKCLNRNGLSCATDSVQVCQAKLGCLWNDVSCINTSQAFCQNYKTQEHCTQSAGCKWLLTECVNRSHN